MPTNRILDHYGRPVTRNGHANGVATVRPRPVQGRYDAAQITKENASHWIEADHRSARAANTPQVRFRLRVRARYETANSCYARGIIETLANDTIGTGPHLQLLTPDADANRAIEAAFNAWSQAVGLAEKLRTMRKARAEDGEAFGVFTTNPKVDHPVKLDLRLYEADQVSTPAFYPTDPLADDGIEYDRSMNPVAYHVLKYHPGDLVTLAPFGAFDRIPASLMVHWFRADRPGQLRGIPDVTPALPLFAMLRRYTLAVLSAAETAADFAAVLYSDLPPDTDLEVPGQQYSEIDIPRRTMVTIPAGWKMGQLEATQPATTYPQFKAEILNEIARCLNMPFNVAAGNSSGYNYSSGRLDHQVYYKSLKVDQSQCERVVLDPLFAAWLAEARLATDLLPPEIDEYPHHWMWDGAEHVDPEKEANAQKTRLGSRTTSYAREYARQGRDWETEFVQIAAEQDRMKELGIVVEAPAAPGLPGAPAGAPPPPKSDEQPPPDEGPDDDLAED